MRSMPRRMVSFCLSLGIAAFTITQCNTLHGQQQRLELHKGDHIAIIGNTLADRLQHYGHLEAMLHYRFPEHSLVVRDLGFSGDTLTERPRSDNFGSPDDWLTKVEADVVFAFFGYNESYAAEA